MHIIIVGGGPVGLACALALAQADPAHTVHVYERTNEGRTDGDGRDLLSGDGVIFHPSASWALQQMGIDVETEMPASEGKWNVIGSAMGSTTEFDHFRWEVGAARGADPTRKILMVTRRDCIDTLMKHVRRLPNVTLHFSAEIRMVLPGQGQVLLADGTRITADLIVGADGLRSICFEPFAHLRPPSEGTAPLDLELGNYNVYSGLVKGELAHQIPEIAEIAREYEWSHSAISGTLRPEAVTTSHPVADHTLVSYRVYIMRKEEPPLSELERERDPVRRQDKVHERIQHGLRLFPELHRAMAAKVMESETGGWLTWEDMRRDAPTRMVLGRVALVGEAAHTLGYRFYASPTVGVEEAAALGALFGKGTQLEQVAGRLEMFQRLRYSRAMRIKYAADGVYIGAQEAAKRLHARTGESVSGQEVEDMFRSHDAAKEARSMLKVIGAMTGLDDLATERLHRSSQ